VQIFWLSLLVRLVFRCPKVIAVTQTRPFVEENLFDHVHGQIIFHGKFARVRGAEDKVLSTASGSFMFIMLDRYLGDSVLGTLGCSMEDSPGWKDYVRHKYKMNQRNSFPGSSLGSENAEYPSKWHVTYVQII